MQLAFYPRRLSDRIVAINGAVIQGTPTLSSYPTINTNYFFSYFKDNQNKILSCKTDCLIEMQLQDSVTGRHYMKGGIPFVGGHPPHAPHYE